MNFVTPDLIRWIKDQKPPHPGFGFRLRENEWGVWLIVSLEELSKYSGPQQEDLAIWLGFLCSSIRSKGIPCYIDREDYNKRGEST